MYYNKILIVSDNLNQCVRVKDLLLELKIDTTNIGWACSMDSPIEVFSKSLSQNIKQIDLRNADTIKEIITHYNLVISIHCKKLFPKELVNSVKCINVHPGYNPHNRGWFPQVFSIIHQNIIGATIHEIDEELDHGKIIDRMIVPINSWDDSLSVYKRVLEAELILLRKNLYAILNNNYKTVEPENEGELYLKKDFNILCNLNLDSLDTLENHIDLLRALTHGDFKNAFFIDKTTGKKVFVKISLELEV